MGIYESAQWITDLDDTIYNITNLDSLAGEHILITGASGLICSAVADVLLRYNETHDIPIYVTVAGRNPEKLNERFARFTKREYFSVVKYDGTERNNQFPTTVTYILHGASNAYPSAIVKEPVESMLVNFNGLYDLLSFAKNHKVKKVVYISSSEVYGKKESSLPSKEDEYGFIDLLNARNSYSVAKRAAETLCASFYDEYGVESSIVRPGHIYGPTASEKDNRVSSAFAYAAVRGADLILKSDGSQIRSYCYCLDCASAILTVMIKGESVKAYNISNPDSVISIRHMAQLLADSAGVAMKFEEPDESEKKGFNPMQNSSLDSTVLQKLGWKGLYDAETGFSHTIDIIRNMMTDRGKDECWKS